MYRLSHSTEISNSDWFVNSFVMVAYKKFILDQSEFDVQRTAKTFPWTTIIKLFLSQSWIFFSYGASVGIFLNSSYLPNTKFQPQ